LRELRRILPEAQITLASASGCCRHLIDADFVDDVLIYDRAVWHRLDQVANGDERENIDPPSRCCFRMPLKPRRSRFYPAHQPEWAMTPNGVVSS